VRGGKKNRGGEKKDRADPSITPRKGEKGDFALMCGEQYMRVGTGIRLGTAPSFFGIAVLRKGGATLSFLGKREKGSQTAAEQHGGKGKESSDWP